MIHKKQFVAVLIAILATIGVLHAQEKYAVIITSDNNATNVPVADRWNNGNGMGTYGFDEFWNDAYLFWEMLFTEKGYTNDNIFVYYDDGYDLSFPLQDGRYNALATYGYNITDEMATHNHVENLFINILPSLVTQDDFLYVWIMGHGGNTQSENDGDAFFYLQNGQKVYDYELASWITNINANRMVFQLEFPSSGGFRNNLADDDTYIFSSTTANGNSYRCDNSPEVENEVISGITYNHGEFNFHTYSAMMGETPAYATSYDNQPLTDANVNDNEFLSFAEAKDWNISNNSTSETPEFLGDIGPYSAADYPTLFIEDFTEDKTYRGIIGVDHDYGYADDDIFLSSNSVTLAEKSILTFFNHTWLYIDGSGVMTIEDDVQVLIEDGGSILSYNEIYIGENVGFIGNPAVGGGGLLVAEDKTLELENVTFQDCHLVCNTLGLDIDYCNFTRSGIKPYVQNASITNSEFDQSWVYFIKPGTGAGQARIGDCNFTDYDGDMQYGIFLQDYDKFTITNCNIDDYKSDGIRIVNCGDEINSKNEISNNSITNCAQWWHVGAMAGLSILNSYAKVFDNYIADNDRGIVSTYNSSVSLYSTDLMAPQQVIDNTINQIWSTDDSFPYYFRYNEMHGVNNPPYHIVYMNQSTLFPKDIRSNCWGSSFNPATPWVYFWPNNNFIWNPVWNCNSSETEAKSADQILFESAELKVENEDYFGAETDYKNLVEDYPDSKYATAALKELYRLEKVTGNDYNELKLYYESFEGDGELTNTAEVLAIDCEIRKEGYIEALEMLNDYLYNSYIDYDDSLYALNQLNYVYFLMGNGGQKSSKAAFSMDNAMSSVQLLEDDRNHYLSKLFKDDVRKETLEQNIEGLKEGELLQNVPNPVKTSTEIWYKVENESNVELVVYSYTGQLMQVINEGKKAKGTHYVKYNANGLKNGIYFYSININGRTTDTKKMTILK